ncbi:hypothetical protein V7O66_05195 [Methanolobus sp. ZRKC3]
MQVRTKFSHPFLRRKQFLKEDAGDGNKKRDEELEGWDDAILINNLDR